MKRKYIPIQIEIVDVTINVFMVSDIVTDWDDFGDNNNLEG